MIPDSIRPFIPTHQAKVIESLAKGEEGAFFIAKMQELERQIADMPVSYDTDGQGDDAIVHLRYFTGAFDWYITEKDMEGDGTQQAFGLVCMHEQELGYIEICDLVELDSAEIDLHWVPKTLGQVKLDRLSRGI